MGASGGGICSSALLRRMRVSTNKLKKCMAPKTKSTTPILALSVSNTPRTSSTLVATAFRPVRYWTFIATLCAMALGPSYFVHRQLSAIYPKTDSLPVLAHVEHDCEATERSGQTVHLSSLRGKVCAIAYIYTVCPHGCAVVIGEMLKLEKEFD